MTITIRTHDGRTVTTEATENGSLEQAIFLTGLWTGVPLCAGLGRCGLCRVRFRSTPPAPTAEERKKLSPDDLKNGWRLACLHPAEPCTLDLPEPVRASKQAVRNIPRAESFSLAVDLGTTTIHWAALSEGDVLAEGGELNPQNGLGGEVMSRLAQSFRPGGASTLKRLVVERLRSLAADMAQATGGHLDRLAVSGNPAMIYLLFGEDVSTLASAPYSLTYRGGEARLLDESLPPVLIPPLLAPFVGADISAGLTMVECGITDDDGHVITCTGNGENGTAYPYLLADLGTNGEFILALSPTKRLAASVPMGPALEGVGLSFGRTAGPGAVTGFDLDPQGLTPRRLAGKTERPGMTGTAYLSLCAHLMHHGILDESGRFSHGTTPIAARLAQRVTTHDDEPAFDCGDGLYLPASDVEEILKVKASFDLAVSALLKAAGIGPAGLNAIYLAGALGEHVNIGDLERLGFLPAGTASKVIRVGNTSLAGTGMLLTYPEAEQWVQRLPGTIRLIDLTTTTNFTDEFVNRMRFTHVG